MDAFVPPPPNFFFVMVVSLSSIKQNLFTHSLIEMQRLVDGRLAALIMHWMGFQLIVKICSGIDRCFSETSALSAPLLCSAVHQVVPEGP